MEHFDAEWMEEFRRQVAEDIQYWPLDQEMAVLRNSYRLLLEELPQDRQGILERYFRLSRQMEIAMVRCAYAQGYRHGQKHPAVPTEE